MPDADVSFEAASPSTDSWEQVDGVEFEVIPSDNDGGEAASTFDPWRGQTLPQREVIDTSGVWEHYKTKSSNLPRSSSGSKIFGACDNLVYDHRYADRCEGCGRVFHK